MNRVKDSEWMYDTPTARRRARYPEPVQGCSANEAGCAGCMNLAKKVLAQTLTTELGLAGD